MRNESLIRYAQLSAPRYTSYPTAAQFTDRVGADEAAGWISEVSAAERLSVYVHLPFCAQLCWYCGCNAAVANDYARVAQYLERLHLEIDRVAALLPAHGSVSMLHFGGGTPTLLRPADFERLADALIDAFGIGDDAEIAVEIDPRQLGRPMAEALARAGVTRASLGVQDFNTEVQRAINRLQPFETVEAAVQNLHDVGIHAHSFDLLYGLPGQTVASVTETANRAARLWPDRLAVFGYGHVPHFKRHQRMIDAGRLPGPGERLAQAEAIGETLVEQGYRSVGFDHYAWPGDPLLLAAESGELHRNFQGYTVDDATTLIGLGVSAISRFPQGYVQNTPDLKAYRDAIDAGGLAGARGVALEAEDHLRAEAIERLMCDFRLDFGELCRRHGFTADALDGALASLTRLARDGLLELSGRRIAIPDHTRRFVRHAAACFDPFVTGAKARFSLAV